MPSSASSASHIYLLSLHDALPIYISLGTLLDVVVAHRGRRAQTVLHLLRVDDAALRGIEPPYAGVTVRLELEAHRQRVRRALVAPRSEEHTSELQSQFHLVCRLLLRLPPTSTFFPYTTLFRFTYPWVRFWMLSSPTAAAARRPSSISFASMMPRFAE